MNTFHPDFHAAAREAMRAAAAAAAPKEQPALAHRAVRRGSPVRPSYAKIEHNPWTRHLSNGDPDGEIIAAVRLAQSRAPRRLAAGFNRLGLKLADFPNRLAILTQTLRKSVPPIDVSRIFAAAGKTIDAPRAYLVHRHRTRWTRRLHKHLTKSAPKRIPLQ
jgi:hypothetical protein